MVYKLDQDNAILERQSFPNPQPISDFKIQDEIKIFTPDKTESFHLNETMEPTAIKLQFIDEQKRAYDDRQHTYVPYFTSTYADTMITSAIDQVNLRLNSMESAINFIDQRVDNLELKVQYLSTKVDNLETRIGIVEFNVTDISHQVHVLRDEFNQYKDSTPNFPKWMEATGKGLTQLGKGLYDGTRQIIKDVGEQVDNAIDHGGDAVAKWVQPLMYGGIAIGSAIAIAATIYLIIHTQNQRRINNMTPGSEEAMAHIRVDAIMSIKGPECKKIVIIIFSALIVTVFTGINATLFIYKVITIAEGSPLIIFNALVILYYTWFTYK